MCTMKPLDLIMIGIDAMDNRQLEVKLILIQAKLDLLADKFNEIEERFKYTSDEIKNVGYELTSVKRIMNNDSQ